MSHSRRTFVKALAATGGALSLGLPRRAFGWSPDARRGAPLKILILGGTGFIGPHQVRYAVARGHKVTVFNRGRHQADLPDSVERLMGDRNGQLDELKGRTWDVVIDNPTSLPRWVRLTGEILGGKCEQYVFISTLSVYESWAQPNVTESAKLATTPEPTSEDVPKYYGALKALSEQEAEKWYPGKVTVIRPGLIVGPGDETDRFTYWPVRIARGGEILCPGNPTDAAQVIDARDLAEWTIRMVEERQYGIYNATGPRSPMGIGEMLAGIRAAMPGSLALKFTWADADFLEQQKVRPWADMPVWFPPKGEMLGWGTANIEKAVAKGLTFRPLAETARETLEWHQTRPAEAQAKLRAGLTPEREAEVLAAWHARKPS
jgi:2'-hydroxyisoflavone reductase